MKKYIALFLCLITVVSLCSCNIYEKLFPDLASLEPTSPEVTTPNETTPEPKEETTESQETMAPEVEQKNPEFMYRSFLNGDEKVLVEKTGKYLYLKDYVPATGGASLAKCETLRYIYYDVDGNGIKDVAIDCGSEKLCLTYDDGIVTLKPLSNEIWEEIEEGDYWYVYDILSLAAPWREAVMSREEIQAVASYAFGVEDGRGDGACGTFYIFRIVVSDEPDENGYYLVTQKHEEYKWCDWEDCADAAVSHQHLYDIVVDYYMLVHERTGEIVKSEIALTTAKWKASQCWNAYDGYVDYAAGNVCVTRIDVADKPEYTNGEMYYHIVWRIEYYHQEVDSEPHYVYDFKHLYVHAQTGECYLSPNIDSPVIGQGK